RGERLNARLKSWHAQRFVQAASECHSLHAASDWRFRPEWKPSPSQEFIKSATLGAPLAWRNPNTVKPFERLRSVSPPFKQLEAPSTAVIGSKPILKKAQAKAQAMTHLPLPSACPPHAELFLKLALASGIMVACLEIGYLLRSPLPYDPIGYMVGRDFANSWL